MSAEEVGTCYSDLQKFKKSSAPDTVLECWKGSAADPAPRLQEIAVRFCIVIYSSIDPDFDFGSNFG